MYAALIIASLSLTLLPGCGSDDPVDALVSSGGSERQETPDSPRLQRTSGKRDTSQKISSYDPDLDLLLADFLDVAAYYGYEVNPDLLSALTMEVTEESLDYEGADPELVVIGLCDFLNIDIWMLHPSKFPGGVPSKIRFERIFFHELGHCLLQLPHRETDILLEHFGRTINIPGKKRVMYPQDMLENEDIDDAYWRHSKRALFDYGFDVAEGELPSIIDQYEDEISNSGFHFHKGCALVH